MNIVKSKKIVPLSIALIMTGLGCTKKIPFETLPVETKTHVVEKSKIDLQGQYLYSSSQQASSRSAADAFPFLSGENKRVRLKLTEKTIDVVEEEKDQRFKDNVLNDKLVLQIPIEHVQFGCAKNSFGECTNKEEMVDDVPWKDRNSIKVNYDGVVSAELQLLPILDSAEFGENCYEPVSSRLKSAVIENDAINIQIERTFKTRIKCMPNEIERLSDLTVSAVYHYSMVKLDSVLSKDYEVISYPSGSIDERSFGLFASNSIKLDVDNNNTDRSEKQIMNRWNPNRKEIVYHLSDEFAKPENAMIKSITEGAVQRLNASLATAGVQFRIRLEEPSGKSPGDIRNSMIVLVEDPVAASVIGYGPQTEDPVTGEIISARTVMFLGTIKKFVRFTYDEILREKQRARLEAERAKQSDGETLSLKLSEQLQSRVATLKKNELVKSVGSIKPMIDSIRLKNSKTAVAGSEAIAASDSAQKALQDQSLARGSNQFIDDRLTPEKIKAIKSEVKGDNRRKNDEFVKGDYASRVRYLHEAKNCAFAPQMDGAGQISTRLASAFPDDAKPWVELNEKEKEAALAIILPEIWVPTLIHELGHNLGLRHNFEASEDKANFYSQEELAAFDIQHEVPFSSVMDYGNDLKTLPVLGKYDLAALNFAYNRKVEVQLPTGEIKKAQVKTTLEDLLQDPELAGAELKPYSFCTDEHVGINAGCKRFDLGTSYAEITANMIQDYEEWYQHRNLRDGRSNMSLFDDLAYARRINMIFKDLRIMMEVAERIVTRFDLPMSAPEWEEIPFLKDLKQATVLSGKFLTRVLLVPDHMCAVAMTNDPTTIIAVERLDNFGEGLVNCSQVRLRPEFTVVAEAGKSFNSKKDANSTNAYMDQIDVRGIWIDKILAARNLLNRQIGIFSMDVISDSFLNVPEVREDLEKTLKGILTDNLIAPVEFRLANGDRAEFEMRIELADSHKIAKAFHPVTARALGLNSDGPTPFTNIVAHQLATSALDPSRRNIADHKLARSVMVLRSSPTVELNVPKGTPMVDIDGVRHTALVDQPVAAEAIKNLNAVSVLEKLTREQLIEILTLREERGQKNPPKDATKDEKQAWKIDSETIENFLMNVVKSSEFYKSLLVGLPTASLNP